MCLLGGDALHGLVVGVEVGVVVNLQGERVEGGGDLDRSATQFTTGRVRVRVRRLTDLCADGVLEGRHARGAHGGHLSSHMRESQGVASQHPVSFRVGCGVLFPGQVLVQPTTLLRTSRKKRGRMSQRSFGLDIYLCRLGAIGLVMREGWEEGEGGIGKRKDGGWWKGFDGLCTSVKSVRWDAQREKMR